MEYFDTLGWKNAFYDIEMGTLRIQHPCGVYKAIGNI